MPGKHKSYGGKKMVKKMTMKMVKKGAKKK